MDNTDVARRKMFRSELPFASAKMVNPRHAIVKINDNPFRSKKLGLFTFSDLSCVSKSESAMFSLKSV
jgi:hypothetical protein